MIDTRGMWWGGAGHWAASRGAEVICSGTRHSAAPISVERVSETEHNSFLQIIHFLLHGHHFPTAAAPHRHTE